MSTSSVASADGIVPRGNLFRVKMLNRMRTQIMTIKRRLIATEEVPVFRVFSIRCVSVLEERRVLVEL